MFKNLIPVQKQEVPVADVSPNQLRPQPKPKVIGPQEIR